MFAAVLVPFFTEWGGLGLSQVQFIQSWFLFWVFVLEIPTGAVADYWGRKHSMVLGAALFGVGMLIYGSEPLITRFLLAEFVLAAGVALLSGAGEALLYDSLKELGKESEAKKIMGRSNSVWLVGMLLSAPLGSYIGAQYGLNYPTLLTAIPFALAVIVGLSMREPRRWGRESESPSYTSIMREGISCLVKDRLLRRLAVNVVVVASAAYYIIWWYQPLLLDFGVRIEQLGWFHVATLLAQIAVSSHFEKLEKFFGSESNYLRYTALMTAIAFLLVGIWPNKLTIMGFLLVGGGFGLTRVEYATAIMNRHVESARRATVLSSISMLRRLVLVPLNPVLGVVADRSLSLALVLVGAAPLLLVLASLRNRVTNLKPRSRT